MADRYLLESGAPDGYLLEDSSGVLLLEGGAQYPLNASASNLDNPVQPRKQAGYIAPAVNLLTTTLAVAVTLVARDPLYTPRPKAAVPQHPQPTNLLQNTLAPSQQAPFKTPDFGNPVRARLVLQDTVSGNLLVTTLAVAPQAKPFTPVHVDRPADRRVQQPEQQQDLLNTTLAVTGTPFRQSDWQNPALPKRVQQPENQTGLLQTALYTTPPTLVARGPLYAPIFGKQAGQQLPHQNLLTNTLAVTGSPQAPFFQTDWPNPIRKPFSWAAHENETTTYYSDVPFKPIDLANPILRRKVQQPDVPIPLLQTTLFTTPPVPPKTSFDWPNPVRKPFNWSPYESESSSYYSESTQAPFKQLDWPNPARNVANLKQHTSFSVTLYDDAIPTNQDWPNPIRPKRIQQIDAPQNLLPIHLTVPFTGPVKQTDWPNPVLPRRVQQPEVPIPLLQTSMYVTPPVPFNGQFDWPNPKPRAPYQQDTAQYQNPDLIPPPVVVPPTDTVQTPAGRHRKRTRYLIRVDGQTFWVEDEKQAQVLLERVTALAPEAADAAAAKLGEKIKSAQRLRPVSLRTPKIVVSPELQPMADLAERKIAEVYKSKSMDLEIKLLLHRKMQQDDDDAAITLILLN